MVKDISEIPIDPAAHFQHQSIPACNIAPRVQHRLRLAKRSVPQPPTPASTRRPRRNRWYTGPRRLATEKTLRVARNVATIREREMCLKLVSLLFCLGVSVYRQHL